MAWRLGIGWLDKYTVSGQVENLQRHESYLNFSLLMWYHGQKQLHFSPKNIFHHFLLKPLLNPPVFLWSFNGVPTAHFLYPTKVIVLLFVCLSFPYTWLWAAWGKTCAFHLCIHDPSTTSMLNAGTMHHETSPSTEVDSLVGQY